VDIHNGMFSERKQKHPIASIDTVVQDLHTPILALLSLWSLHCYAVGTVEGGRGQVCVIDVEVSRERLVETPHWVTRKPQIAADRW
jgi:hypothetical protein